MATVREVLEAGLAHYRAGRLDRAASIYAQVLAFDPDQPDALRLMAILENDRGRHDNAMAAIARARRAAPANAELAFLHGMVEDRAGLSSAADRLCQALALAPDTAAAHVHLADLARRGGHIDRAIVHFEHAAVLDPDQALWHHKLGAAYQQHGLIEPALGAFARGIQRDPADAVGRYNLGTLLYERRRMAEALSALAASVALDPENADAQFNRGVAASNAGDLALAVACLELAVALRPDYAEAWNSLGAAIQNQGELDRGLACFRRAIELNPGYDEAHSNLLFFLNYLPGTTDRDHFVANRRWAERLEAACPARPPLANTPDPDRRIRLGFISPEFKDNQNFLVFFEPVLALHDRRRFEIVCYGDVAQPDGTTRRIAAMADRWRDVSGLDNRARGDLVRADGIDILVNLCGWVPLHRALFADRLAPVQAAYINHVSTTGLANMDYRITDPWLDPLGRTEADNTETLTRLQSGYLVYRPPDFAPSVTPLPALTRGYVTFGSFNHLTKVTPEVVALWADILHAVPGSRLLIKAATLSDIGARSRYLRLFADRGIAPARIDMVGQVPDNADNLRVLLGADIALDPFPFNGGRSTCDALTMGLPVVAAMGDSMIARVAASMVTRAGLGELVGADLGAYRDIAVTLALDVPRLARMRADMPRRLASSVLCDIAGHARELDAAYGDMWRRWCRKARG